jgi:hypothetical protein
MREKGAVWMSAKKRRKLCNKMEEHPPRCSVLVAPRLHSAVASSCPRLSALEQGRAHEQSVRSMAVVRMRKPARDSSQALFPWHQAASQPVVVNNITLTITQYLGRPHYGSGRLQLCGRYWRRVGARRNPAIASRLTGGLSQQGTAHQGHAGPPGGR